MKKSLITAIVCISAVASAQVAFSAKANLLFPTNDGTWKSIRQTATNAYSEGGKNSAGFNVGLSAKVNLPFSLFLMPEVFYTSFKNEYRDSATNTELTAHSDRIDVPVLVGYNVWGDTIGAFIGPVGSFNLSKNGQFNDFKENAKSEFTVGMQVGAQAQLGKFLANARYEGALSKDQRTFVNNVAGASTSEIRYDSRPSMFIVGVGYKF